MNVRRMRVDVGLAVAATAIFVSGAGCKRSTGGNPARSGERPSLGSIAVKPIPPMDFRGRELRLDEARLGAKVKSVLDGSGMFGEPRPKLPTLGVAVEAQPFLEGSDEALEIGVRLRLRMTVRPEGGGMAARYADDALAIGQTPLETRDPTEAKTAFDRLTERTATDLVQSYVGRQKLWSNESREMDGILRSTDNELRVEALRVIGARNLRELSPSVLRLLSDEEESVRDAALGAAVALEDRNAVRTLAQSRQMRDAREMRKILDAIATLGGAEAGEYLGFVAETHDDEEIRVMAKSALERMRKRDASKQPTR